MTAMRRGGPTTFTALRERVINWNAIPKKPLKSRRSSPTTLPPPPPALLDKYIAADQALLDGSTVSSAAKVEAVPNVLRPRVVVYDGVCHLCHAGVKWLIKTDEDRKINFCCLQSKAAEPYMSVSGLKREDVRRQFLFVEGPGSYHQGSAAGLRVLSFLPLPYSVLSVLTIVPAPLRDALYDHVTQRGRHWFGRDDDCIVLKETELLERFIDSEELLERQCHSRQIFTVESN